MRRTKIAMIALGLSVLLLAGCTSGGKEKKEDSKQAASIDKVLKPGDKDFSFDYNLPDDWEPQEYTKGNGEKIRDDLLSQDSGKGTVPVEDFYEGIELYCKYAEIPDNTFWNINTDMPKECYTLPVNMLVEKNDFRLVSGKEFTSLNVERIPYYVQAAKRAIMVYDNVSGDKLDEFLERALYYELPGKEAKDTRPYYYKNILMEVKAEQEAAAFITDDSLCYLASDGSIRVRGLLLYHNKLEGTTEYGRAITEIAIGVTPEAVKTQSNDWNFGDFYLIHNFDVIQSALIDEKEYLSLLETYNAEIGIPDLPDWAGTYGGVK